MREAVIRCKNPDYINVVSENGTVVSNPGYIVPVTAFIATPTVGSMPLTVSFTDQSTGSPTSWKWTFGDGNTSTEKNPVHTYNKSGRYTVTLTASNANGSNALTKSSYIVCLKHFSCSCFQILCISNFRKHASYCPFYRPEHRIANFMEMDFWRWKYFNRERILYTHTINQDDTLLP